MIVWSPKFLNPTGISCPLTAIYLTVDSVLFSINVMYVMPVCKQVMITLSALQLMYFFPPLPCITLGFWSFPWWLRVPNRNSFQKDTPSHHHLMLVYWKMRGCPFQAPVHPSCRKPWEVGNPEEHVLRAPDPRLKTQNFAICPTSVKLHSEQTTLFSKRCVILGKVSGRQDTAINV